MKINNSVPHGKIGHLHTSECDGYARGGRVPIAPSGPPKGGYPMAYHAPEAGGGGGGGSTKLNMTDLLAALGAMGVAIPAAKMAFGAGKPAPTDLMKDVQGNIGSLDTSQNAVGMADGGEVMDMDDDDPADVPEDIKEFVDLAHQKMAESRPDENWRIKPPEKPEPVAAYKRDEEDVAEAEEAAEDSAIPAMSDGGEVQGFDDGGVIPQPMTMDGVPPPAAFLDPNTTQPLPMNAPMPKLASAAAPAAPIVPRETAPAPTEADFMTKANNMLGLNPSEQAGFMKLLGDHSQKGQIGAAIAGIGDAIASGGTLGKVNPGNMDRSENIIQGKEKAGIEGMQTIHGNQEKATELSQKLQAQDPNSPLSKFAQKAYAAVGKKIGIDLSHASASLISDVTGKGVDALTSEYQEDLKKEGLAIQRGQLEAMSANQKAERDVARQGQQLTAAEKLGSRTLGNKLEGIIPGTPANAEKKTLENIASGVKTFSSVEEAEGAGLPVGTRVSINGRMATIK